MKEVRRNYFVRVVDDEGRERYGYVSKKELDELIKRNINVELKFKIINR